MGNTDIPLQCELRARLEAVRVSEAGIRLALGLHDWMKGRRDATHFWVAGDRIVFRDDEARDDFLRALHISENDACIEHGEAAKIHHVLCTFADTWPPAKAPQPLQTVLAMALGRVRGFTTQH